MRLVIKQTFINHHINTPIHARAHTYQNSPSSLRFCSLLLEDESTLSHSLALKTAQHYEQCHIISILLYILLKDFSFLLITPSSSPLHLSPGVSDAHQLGGGSSENHLTHIHTFHGVYSSITKSGLHQRLGKAPTCHAFILVY